jgi:hypothetical protein
VPSNLAEPVIAALGGSSPITARQLTVLPDPDSPTMASVCPAYAEKLTPPTARTGRPRPVNVTLRSLTSSSASVTVSACSYGPSFTEGVADQVER